MICCSRKTSLRHGLALAAIWCVFAGAAVRGADPNPDPDQKWLYLTQPALDLAEPEIYWPDDLLISWLPALEHGESDLRRDAADSIILAQKHGMPHLERTTELLVQVLETPEENPVTRTAAARALIAIDARDQAPVLAKHAAVGPQPLTAAVDMALARWDYKPARDVWLEQLNSPTANSASKHRAMRALAVVGDRRAVPPLVGVAMSSTVDSTTRLIAARALAAFPEDDLLRRSLALMNRSSARALVDRLVGVHMLGGLRSDAALDLMDAYAQVPQSTVAAEAMRQMLDRDPSRLVSRAADTITHSDANIRFLTVRALASAPSIAAIEILVGVLDDPVPDVRREARRTLLRYAADPELADVVIDRVADVLSGEDWRELQQSILILVELNQRQVGERLLELLEHDRPEVYTTSAWGLRELADPKYGDAMFEAVERISADSKQGPVTGQPAVMLAYLIEGLGVIRYTAALDHLQQYIPKLAPFEGGTRAAAIWTVGMLLEDKPDAAIAAKLESRLADTSAMPIEHEVVRGLAAVSLGRMRSESSLPLIREWYDTESADTFIGRRSGWAIERMAGEPLPPLRPQPMYTGGWFIEPL